MASMDYCKFENTSVALAQCMDDIRDMGEIEEAELPTQDGSSRAKIILDGLSRTELQGLCGIVAMAQEIIDLGDDFLDAVDDAIQN